MSGSYKGVNFVELQGKLSSGKSTVSRNGRAHYTAKLCIPKTFTDSFGKDVNSVDYIKIGAWGELAESFADVSEGSWVKIHGEYEERSYDSSCSSCSSPTKKYWSEIQVHNFVVLD